MQEQKKPPKTTVLEDVVNEKETIPLTSLSSSYMDMLETRVMEPDTHNFSKGGNVEHDISWLRIVDVNGSRKYSVCRNFIVSNIHDSFNERVQIIETSDEPVISFFGKRNHIIPITGILKNSAEHPWTHEMVERWENGMRGTLLADNGLILQIYCNKTLYRGYPISFSMSLSATNDLIANFSLQMAVVNRTGNYSNGQMEK